MDSLIVGKKTHLYKSLASHRTHSRSMRSFESRQGETRGLGAEWTNANPASLLVLGSDGFIQKTANPGCVSSIVWTLASTLLRE